MSREELSQIAKFVLTRCYKIKNKEAYKECIENLCHYFTYLINKFETPERKITKKTLISMGIKEMSPREPLIINNPKISIQRYNDGLYDV